MRLRGNTDLGALARELHRPQYTLEVTRRDPFTAAQPARKAAAEWVADLWQRLNIKPGAHIRRVHYVLVSQPEGTVLLPDGTAYLNAEKPYELLNTSSLDARYLRLISANDLVDRRNHEPVIYLPNDASDPELDLIGELPENELRVFDVPSLS